MISKKDVEHVALLARLGLKEKEKEKFQKQLTKIIENADKINKLDTKKVEPTSHAVQIKNIFRKDEKKECLTQEEALSNAPKKEDGQFFVPKII